MNRYPEYTTYSWSGTRFYNTVERQIISPDLVQRNR